jgi:hypothetical protein
MRVLLFIALVASAMPLLAGNDGYVEPISAMAGDTLQFRISTGLKRFDLEIYRCGAKDSLVTTLRSVPGLTQAVPDSAYYHGCGWKSLCSLRIPDTWRPGVYSARISSAYASLPMLFVVRSRTPGALSKLVLTLSANTWQAYNRYGGKSLYGYNSTDTTPSVKVSFRRPMLSSDFDTRTRRLIAWLEREHIDAEFLMDTDLDRSPTALDPYEALVISGHDEYWTRAERSSVERFIGRGKGVAILGGNTCWCQVRLEDTNHTLVCYRKALKDPMHPSQDSLVTEVWSGTTLRDPENKWTGVSYRNGGYVNGGNSLPAAKGFGDYVVWNAHHWLYEGTGLQDGDSFGYRTPIVGYEVDGALFQWRSGIPTVTGADSSPTNYQILAVSPATTGTGVQPGHHATMGIYFAPSGGAIFNAATTNWVSGLTSDTIVQRITRNAIGALLAHRYAPVITAWAPSVVIPDTVHGEPVVFSGRTIDLRVNDPVVFAVAATDPAGATLHYRWLVDGAIASTDSTFQWISVYKDREVQHAISVVVSNGHDSTGLRWIVTTSLLKIMPDCGHAVIPPHGYYVRQVEVASRFSDSLTYQLLVAPSWLTVSPSGELSGVAGDREGIYPVVLRVQNLRGDCDTNASVIRVCLFAGVEDRSEVPAVAILSAAPNPFTATTRIAYRVAARTKVRLEVFDMLGRRVAVPADVEREPGVYETEVDGAGLRSGVYRCVIRSGASTLSSAIGIVRMGESMP